MTSSGAAVGARHVLVVEPYAVDSHRAWAEGFARASGHRVSLVTHEGAFWRWRLRGAALTLAAEVRGVVERAGPVDVLLVGGMVDVPALVGLARPALDGVPVVVYLHESQLLYPRDAPSPPGDEQLAVNWLSMAAADRVWCNSAHHRDALLAALPAYLDRAPDHSHAPFLAQVVARTSVMTPGVDLRGIVDGHRGADGESPLIVWNQRWDHDRRPEAFLRVLCRLADHGVAFRVAFAGANRRVDPREFDRAVAALGERVVHVGHLPRRDYVALLLRADVVVSTAAYELFGIAAVEAMAAGAVPLLPDRLAYPELVPAELRPVCLYRSDLYGHLRAVLEDLDAAREAVAGLRDAMRVHDWDVVAPRYDEALRDVVADYGRPSC